MKKIILLTILVSACAKEPDTVYEYYPIPGSLLSCQEAPNVPLGGTQRNVAAYVVMLHEAGADCRMRLAAVKHLVD